MMTDNPYQSPEGRGEVQGVLSGSREDLRSVATYQKGILICILLYLIAVVLQFFIPVELRPAIGIGVLLIGLVGAIFVFLLAMKVYGTVSGILLGILSLVPCLGLLILLIVNGKATGILKQNGIQVGLLGADISKI